jgi:PAS domain S-box-containing protein
MGTKHNASSSRPSRRLLEAEIDSLRQRLEEAEITLDAITSGRVDALVVAHPVEERQVLVLEDVRRGDRLPIDRLRQGAITVSAAGAVVHANAAFAALVGIDVEQLLGRRIEDLVSELDRATLAELLSDRNAGPLTALGFDCADGSVLRVYVACIPLADHSAICLIVTGLHDGAEDEAAATVRALRRGEIDAVVVAESDDAPRVLLLGAAGRRYRLLVEHMHDGAVTLSPEGDVLYANPSFAAMIGVLPPAVIGLRFADLVDERSRPLLEAFSDGRRGAASHAEVTIIRNNGGSFRASLTPLPATDAYGVSMIVTDLTSRLRLEEAEQTLRAIGGGEVDAFVVGGDQRPEVQTLSGAHRPYRVMVERMQQGAVTLSHRGDILYTNQPFAEMLGQPIAALIGLPLAELVPPTDRALLAALVDARHGSTTQGELVLLRRDGGRISTLVAVALLPEEGGVCLIVTDLTKQKAYEALVAAQALERSILEQAVDAIVLCDADGRVIRASRAALELCGQNPLLLPFSEGFPLESANGPPDLKHVFLGGTLRGAEYTLRPPGLPEATVLLSAGPVTDADTRVRGCVVTMTDISERRMAEDRLRESNRHKDEFLAILAHELRNPLAPIRTAVEILRTADLTSHRNAAYAVEIIGRQSSNLIRLVDDLLDINRINQGKIVLQLARIDMRAVVEQAIETCRPLIASRQHRLETRLPADFVAVRGDLVRLAQVVVNLLTNAANYTPPGGRIDLTLGVSDGVPSEAVVSVIDNGIGIAPEMVAQIFEPYQQGSQQKDRATGGLGLGLTVCKRLMEMHGGSVAAHSDGPGRGSRFVARLALADDQGARQLQRSSAPERAAPLRVLIVDDNRDAAESLAKLMQMSGHEVCTLANGAAAVANAASFRPDVVLLDIGMPGMNGYEVARRLRDLPASSSMYLIAMTGYGSEEDRARSAESGFDEHLVKPLDFAALEALLAARL